MLGGTVVREQMMMEVPELDKEKTRENVEKMLEKYRMFLVTLPKDIMPKMTAGYSIVPPNFGNEFRSSTESVALQRIEWEEKRNGFIKLMLEAVEQLGVEEKFIIFNRFLDKYEGYDREIWLEMGIGRSKYYQMKRDALFSLAFLLNVEVYI